MIVAWLSALAVGIGTSLMAYSLLSLLAEGVSNLLFGKQRRMLRILRGRDEITPARKVTPDELLGLGSVPWVQLYLLGAALGLGLYFFTGQALALFLVIVPFAVRTWLTNQRRRELGNETLAFLTDLRLAIPLQGSLLRALQDVAERGRTRLAQITARYLQGGWSGGGLELLEQLAEDTRLPYLNDLVAWTRAAEEGTMASDAPFEHALARLQAESYTTACEYMQRIPTRLTVLVLPALLGPAIVLLLYPVVARLLASMGNMGWGGGF